MGPKKVQSFPFLAEGFGVEFNSLGQPLISEPGPPVLHGFLHDALKWAGQSSWKEGSVRARFLKAMDGMGITDQCEGHNLYNKALAICKAADKLGESSAKNKAVQETGPCSLRYVLLRIAVIEMTH